VIGQELDLPPSKVFFGINLIRAKMKLPKLDFPKRKLAVTPDQLMAVQALYEPYLPVPPIGIHKIIAKQLRMDEWRVHVAIGLIRKSKNMPRWNEDREDIPEAMKEMIRKANEGMKEDIAAQQTEQQPIEATAAESAESGVEAAVAEEPTVAHAPASSEADNSESGPLEAAETPPTTEEAPVKKKRVSKAAAAAAAVEPEAEPAPAGDEEAPPEKKTRGRKPAAAATTAEGVKKTTRKPKAAATVEASEES
jgi:hypothetical protein